MLYTLCFSGGLEVYLGFLFRRGSPGIPVLKTAFGDFQMMYFFASIESTAQNLVRIHCLN